MRGGLEKKKPAGAKLRPAKSRFEKVGGLYLRSKETGDGSAAAICIVAGTSGSASCASSPPEIAGTDALRIAAVANPMEMMRWIGLTGASP